MEISVNENSVCQPQQDETNLPSEQGNTTPLEDTQKSDFIEVKFNKEIKKLTFDEAATLAQKGMKFDMISGELERLKDLSKGEGLSVPEYLRKLEQTANEQKLKALAEKCGDEELAERIIKLESNTSDEFEALKAEFPEIESEEVIPQEVKTAAQLKGTGLLFEYLLYDRRLRLAAEEEQNRQQAAGQASLGSLSSGFAVNTVDAEFLKGIWGR